MHWMFWVKERILHNGREDLMQAVALDTLKLARNLESTGFAARLA